MVDRTFNYVIKRKETDQSKDRIKYGHPNLKNIFKRLVGTGRK
jgi:hypothetical protein